jgi:hypothetical protein
MKLFLKRRKALLILGLVVPFIVIAISGRALASQTGPGNSIGGGASNSQTSPGGGASGSQVSPGSGGTIKINPPSLGGKNLPSNAMDLLKAVINFLTVDVAPPLIALVVIWAAFMFLTAGGNPKNIEKAKQALLYAVIGTIIILIGQGIVYIIQNFLQSVPSSTTTGAVNIAAAKIYSGRII